jgi:hypothetical protein
MYSKEEKKGLSEKKMSMVDLFQREKKSKLITEFQIFKRKTLPIMIMQLRWK